jgi:hypothetical protein
VARRFGTSAYIEMNWAPFIDAPSVIESQLWILIWGTPKRRFGGSCKFQQKKMFARYNDSAR